MEKSKCPICQSDMMITTNQLALYCRPFDHEFFCYVQEQMIVIYFTGDGFTFYHRLNGHWWITRPYLSGNEPYVSANETAAFFLALREKVKQSMLFV